jgi:hypothetical protein
MLQIGTEPSAAKKLIGGRKGRLTKAAKSKFTSTPNLAAELSSKDDLADIANFEDFDSMTADDISQRERPKSAFSLVNRSNTPTTDYSGLVNTASFNYDQKTDSKDWKPTTLDFSKDIGESESREGENVVNVKSRAQIFEDRLSMPPPTTTEVPQSRVIKANPKAPTEITFDQAKDILLGKTRITSSGDSFSSYSSTRTVQSNSSNESSPGLRQSSSSVFQSAPWRSVYAATSTTTSLTTATTSHAYDLDETPVKELVQSPRSRSRLELHNTGAVSPIPKSQVGHK